MLHRKHLILSLNRRRVCRTVFILLIKNQMSPCLSLKGFPKPSLHLSFPLDLWNWMCWIGTSTLVHTWHCDVTFTHVIRSRCNSAAPQICVQQRHHFVYPDALSLSAHLDSSVKAADVILELWCWRKSSRERCLTQTLCSSVVLLLLLGPVSIDGGSDIQ